MAIESRITNDEIDIKHLAVESPESFEESDFDPNKELTEEQWDRIKTDVIFFSWNANNVKGAEGFLRHLRELSIINFKKTREVFALTEQDKKELRDHAHSIPHRSDLGTIADFADYKVVFPEQDLELPALDVAQRSIDRQWSEVIQNKDELDTYRLANLAANLKIIYPDKIFLTEEMWEQIEKMKEDYKKDNRIEFFAEISRNMRIIDEDKFMQAGGISPQLLKRIKDLFVSRLKMTDFNSSVATSVAEPLKILAAEKVKVTEKGLEINMPVKSAFRTQHTTPVPDIKKF